MINKLINYFENKKILILGFGREGKSTYKLIRKYFKEQKLYISDLNAAAFENCEGLSDDKNVELISGESYLDNLENYDLIMKAPGVSFVGIETNKFIKNVKSQLELLLEFFDNFTIGITGTKGKSTTSTMTYNMLQENGKKCMFLGNIGIPVFDFIEEIESDTIIVLEMSSHHLEFMEVSPKIAVLLNAAEEHLDHYNSYDDYVLAKCNVFKYQKANDHFLYGYDNETLKRLVKDIKGNEYKICLDNKVGYTHRENDKVYVNGKEVFDDKKDKRTIVGDYNLLNIMFVLTISEILGLDIEKTKKAIEKFVTLPHRLEFVGKFEDVYYYDNAIGTVPMATIEAVNALKNVDTLIIGGMDRGLDYTDFIKYLNECEVRNIICMPKTGHDIAKHLIETKAYVVETLEEAVEVARDVTEKNKSCLLAPAAASYGFFKNFEEKGNLFQELVRKIGK